MQGRCCFYASLVSLVLGAWNPAESFESPEVSGAQGACRTGSFESPQNHLVHSSDGYIWSQIIYMGNLPAKAPENDVNRSAELCTQICMASSDCEGIEAHSTQCEFWLKKPTTVYESAEYQCWVKKDNETTNKTLYMFFGLEVSNLATLKKHQKGLTMPNVASLLNTSYADYEFKACGELESKTVRITVWVKTDPNKIKSMANFLSPPNRTDAVQPNIFPMLEKAMECDLTSGASGESCLPMGDYTENMSAVDAPTIMWENNLKRNMEFLAEVPSCTADKAGGQGFVDLFDTKSGKGLYEAVMFDSKTRKEEEETDGTIIMRGRCGFVSLMIALASAVLS